MEIHHCENPVCRFVTRHAVPDTCPLCGGAFFLPSDGSDLVAADWVALGIESKTDGRFDDAFSDFEKAAAEGDAAGQCMLGLAYETGEGVAQSWPDAVLLYRAAAGQGHAQAQCNLGWCHEFGKGVPQDAKAAARWYGEAALQHDPRAECCLAICYTNGTGVAADSVRAAQLYTLSAQAGFVPAMRNLAQMIHLGRGTAKNDEAALAWYQKAAAQDDARALFMCGQFYEKGFGVESNAPLAADFYLRAARQGYAPAQACYAICLEYGRGVPANPTEAVIYGLIFVALTMLIVMGGIGGGIEKVCSVGMPALFVALLICIIRACTLEGTDVAVQILQADGSLVEGVVNGSALDGLKYMFSPGWAANVGYYVPAKAVVDGAEVSSIMVNGVAQAIVAYKSGAPSIFSVVSTAGGQMFFSLSLGMGAMITYGSYLHKKENLQKNALLIIIMDTMVALMAGLCVMPARFALDPAGNIGGPKLLFITMQNVFHSMGTLGPIFGILFYLLVVFAAISSSISLLEVIVAHFVDKARAEGKGDKRKSYTLIATALVSLGCILVCADALGTSGISPADLLGIENPKTWAADWLDFWDCISEGIMMPLGALLMTFMVAYEIGTEFVKDEIEQCGNKFTMYKFYRFCIRYVTPLGLLLVLYGQIKSFFF